MSLLSASIPVSSLIKIKASSSELMTFSGVFGVLSTDSCELLEVLFVGYSKLLELDETLCATENCEEASSSPFLVPQLVKINKPISIVIIIHNFFIFYPFIIEIV